MKRHELKGLERRSPIRRIAKRHSQSAEAATGAPNAARPLEGGTEADLEIERYELRERPAYRFAVDRRDFFKTLGCGVAIFLLLDVSDGQESGRRGRGGLGGRRPVELGAWLHLGEDGIVTVFTGKAEVGQNTRTALTQAVAEELPVPVENIRLIMADTELTPFDAGTFGSRSTPDMNPQLRRVGAAAREALLDLAAEHFNTDRALLTIATGRVSKGAANESIAFGELIKGRTLTHEVTGSVSLKPASEWNVAGTSLPKVNGRDLVTGKHHYASDIIRPGMLHGRILRPAAFGAQMTSADTSAAEAMTDVTVVRDRDFVGVVAKDSFAAEQALATIKADWKTTPQPSDAELFEHLKKNAAPGGRGSNSGSVADGLAAADHQLDATYQIAYIAHTPLEPRAAVAEWKGDKLTVWTGSQRPFGVRSDLAQAFGIADDKVRVIVPDTGSGYGGKHTGEAAIEAARLAKGAGKPVKVVWTREEEFTWAYFRPAGVIEIKSGVKQDGTLTAWEFHNYNSGGSALGTPYDVPNQRIEFHSTDSPLRQGSYRALASTANVFARESHMDELAHAVGLDPLEFRLKNLKNDRLRNVFEAAAKGFGWDKVKSTPTRGFGLGGGTEKGSYLAACAEVAINPDKGDVKVVRVTVAFECGAIVNPKHLENQVEGAVVMGLGGALFEAVKFNNGRIVNPHLATYRVPRFTDAPPIQTILLNRTDLTSAGAGETPIIGIAPAIGNALFAATGRRIRSLPMVPNGLRA
jgi:nicotinate dehydrogenase subunit B